MKNNEIVKIVYKCNYCGCEIEVLTHPYIDNSEMLKKHQLECNGFGLLTEKEAKNENI
jgi:hypothetical protein